tara:strand:+ start:6275 stop:6406 length:132 start_codon:yes stop_codon:yes gene_type:complete
MKIEIIKKFNGHDVIVNGKWKMWVIGSKRNAKKELKKEYGLTA